MPPPEAFDIMSAKSLRRAFEAEKQCSERQFEALKDAGAVAMISSAVGDFCRQRGFDVEVSEDPAKVPGIRSGFRFKYSSPGSGELQEQIKRMGQGKNAAIAWVSEEGAVIGYGIALLSKTETNIKIIDVAPCSRREVGLSHEIVLAGETFSVGVGHVVVHALLQHCRCPFRTDATSASSRFIFKSLGFVPASGSNDNLCLLELRVTPK